MKEYNCDLHLHGLYAGGVSKNMFIPTLAEQAKLKGLHVLATADMLHREWTKHVKESITEEGNGVYSDKKGNANFIIGTEVEDTKRVHHLIYFPDIASAETLKQKLSGKAVFDCVMCGRPKIRVNAEEIAEKVEEAGGIMGPAHSFTPYTGIYAHYDSLKDAYGKMHDKILFLELGLSADTDIADLMEENHSYSFVCFSDAHSPWPNRLGREFTRIKMKQPCFKELKKALEKKDEKLITMNVGLNPKEGKYHLTACASCFQKFTVENAEKLKWKCTNCRGEIKKGVKDRITQLASLKETKHPEFRPPYLHFVPLAEIIQSALKVENVNSLKVQEKWKQFVDAFGTEIRTLIDVPTSELKELDQNIGEKIEAFRNDWVVYIPGGGGNYGKPIICSTEKEFKKKQEEIENELKKEMTSHAQKKLDEF